ncbi:MAG: L-threonylcarbamoyladenylate synthase [Flavisolibacter sp.]
MELNFNENEIERTLETLKGGGIILYPTDTIWGLGCDATNGKAIQRIYAIKNRPAQKGFIILVADQADILKYVANPDPEVFNFIDNLTKPTTIIFSHPIGLPEELVGGDDTVAIRLVQDSFCRHLIKRLRKPIVSTSANKSGIKSPTIFSDIDNSLKSQVDYIVTYRQQDSHAVPPSQIIKWGLNGQYTVIRP